MSSLIACYSLLFTNCPAMFFLFSRVHATQQPALSIGPSVCPSITLIFFRRFKVILSKFPFCLLVCLNYRTRLRCWPCSVKKTETLNDHFISCGMITFHVNLFENAAKKCSKRQFAACFRTR